MSHKSQPTVLSRRRFFDKIVAAGFGVASASALTGFAPRGTPTEDGMHGPVRQAADVLRMPVSPWGRKLVAPYDDGRPLTAHWAVAYVAQAPGGEVIFVLVDLKTGGHAEIELRKRDRRARALAGSRHYDLFLRGRPAGDAPAHLRRLGDRLAGVIGRRERDVKVGHVA
ncbi:MAG: hypothetical protein KC502_12995 [Myxococcales bacterium]|nr:hypothetical protein [Myxococcales bacterium]